MEMLWFSYELCIRRHNKMLMFYFFRGAPVMEMLWFSYEPSIRRHDRMKHFFMAPGGR